MTEPACAQCHEMAPELALGVLAGAERARAIGHLDNCADCRAYVSRLTITGEQLLGLVPGVEPPIGFERRVMSAIQPPPVRRRRSALIAAVLLALVLASGGWAVGRYLSGDSPTVTARAGDRSIIFAPLVSAERQVGQVYAYPGQHSWVYVALDGDAGLSTGAVTCVLERRDGSTVTVGTFTLDNGYAAWGAPAPVDRDSLASARLVDASGKILAVARFAS